MPNPTPATLDASSVETMVRGYAESRADLQKALLEQLRLRPFIAGQLVTELLLAMGYGGSRADINEAVIKTDDRRIHGLIKQDRLGLDTIYIHAEFSHTDPIGQSSLEEFAQKLQLHRTSKGLFFTTSTFSPEAADFVAKLDSRIVLIDGQKLAELLFEHNVGVSVEATFRVKKFDSQYF